MIPASPLLALATLAGCTDDAGPASSATQRLTVETGRSADSSDTAAPTPTETGEPDTGSTGETGAVDPCLGLSPTPLSATVLDDYPSSEEFHFDAAGNVWNASGSVLYKTPYGGAPVEHAPYAVAEAAGTRILPDGSGIAVANEWNGSVDRIDLVTGAKSVIAASIDSPNSIGFDDRGFLYVAAYGAVLRYPLAGGGPEVLVSLPSHDFDGITFAPDFSRVYFNHDDGGTIGYVDLAVDGAVLNVGVLAQINQAGSPVELDGATADACGNVYVVGTSGDVYRVDPLGNAIRYFTVPGGAWTTSINFGSGVGGWGRDRLYVMERYNGLRVELEVGVDGYPEPHYP